MLAMATGGGVAWRHLTILNNPELWRDDLTVQEQVALVKRYLRRRGWRMHEPPTWVNVFVRCNRNSDWLNLIVHSKATLGLRMLAQDFIQRTSERPFPCGVLTRERVPPDLAHEMLRFGLFFVEPSNLADVEEHIRRAAQTLVELTQKAKAERAPVLQIGEPSPE